MSGEAILASLQAILGELRAVHAAIAGGRAAGRPDAADAELLRAIAMSVGDHVFCAADLFDRVRPGPGSDPLQAAIVAATGDLSARKLGKLLRRIEGRNLDGFEVIRTGLAAREGLIWQVRAASLRV